MKFSLGRLFDNKRFLMVFALFAAAVLWLWVAVLSQTEIDLPIHDVPVTINTQSEILADRNLSVIVDSETYVSVVLRGPRTVLGSLKPENIIITPRFSGITAAGTYDLALGLDNSSDIKNMPDVSLLSIDPPTMRLRFDSMTTRTFIIDPVVKGLSTTSEFMSDPEKVTPSKVTVTGPEADLDKIDKVVVSYDLNEPLTRTLSQVLPIQLLDAQGKEISSNNRHLVMDHIEAQLVVTVRKFKTLPFVVKFTDNLPAGFPLEELEAVMNLSDYEITVAGPVDTTDNYRELPLGHIDLSELTIDNNVFNFDVNLPSNAFTNVNNINNVLVSFATDDWSKGSFNIKLSEDDMTNQPPLYDVSLMTKSLSNVMLVGDKEIIEELTAEDIVATIDLADRELKPGQYNYPVKISVPTKGLVWAAGEYSAIIQVVERAS